MTDKVSYFADPQRSTISELYKDIDELSISKFVNELLSIVPNFVVVLNSNRQIITVNYEFLSFLGIDNPADLLGLRLGEALKCDYSDIMPAGCGTSKYCSSCKMAISIVTALDNSKNNETFCSILSSKNGITKEYYLSVKSSRVILNKKKYILVFLSDLSNQQKRSYLEQKFFGEISNLINILNENISIISKNPEQLESQCSSVKLITKLINKELDYHKALFNKSDFDFTLENESISIFQLFDNIDKIFKNNQVSGKINFSLIYPEEDFSFISDEILITRILMNMLINAFEHSQSKDTVKIWIEKTEKQISFKVWNDFYIPEETAIRIFQKYFTTYDDIGRGLGTYFMKYFGEKILGGKVDFTTTKNTGTTFSLSIQLIQ